MQAVVQSPLASGESITSVFKTDFTKLSLQEIVETSKYLGQLLTGILKSLRWLRAYVICP